MKIVFGKLLVLTLLFGVIEAGLDVGNAAAPAEHPDSHEIHSHAGDGETAPDGDDGQIAHYCHCSTHAAALILSVDAPTVVSRGNTSIRRANIYASLTFPPPVPPPNA